MKRDIFVVNAYIVDANGTFSQLSGYPKAFDSRHYNNDVDKTLDRAYSDYHEVLGAMYKADTRQVQIAEVMQMSTGMVLELRRVGTLADLPDPEPEEETEPEHTT
jgi:hypothetical protein